jgi:antitoxin (DNA-binding transcriptional repressor) of toxin-antitoxin stability system
MKFVSTRELRNRPGFVRELMQKEDLVLTSDGKPVAMILGIENEDLEETAQAIRQVKAQRALSRLRRSAAKSEASKLSGSDINREIQSARGKRKPA